MEDKHSVIDMKITITSDFDSTNTSISRFYHYNTFDKLFLYKIETPPAGRPLNNSVVVSLPAILTCT